MSVSWLGWSAPWWVQVVYGAAALGLAIYGLYYLVVVGLWVAGRSGASPRPSTATEVRPFVTIQVPVHNERHVVPRVLQAVGRLDWPRTALEVQVLDDSDDDSGPVVERAVDAARKTGLHVDWLRRTHREGFKAGAMNHGLQTARGEMVAVFDADFVPPPDFLHETVSHLSDEAVCCVQTRWCHLNEGHTWLSRAVAIGLDAHFAVEQSVRGRHRLLLSFNATSCVWRRSDLEAVGGWPTSTLTEDLDLTVQMALCERRFVYLEGPAVPAELPVEVLGFARQQERWAFGSMENLRLHGAKILRSRWTLGRKVDAVFHLAHYVIHPLMVLLFLGMVLSVPYPPPPSGVFGAFAVAAGLGPAILLLAGQWRSHRWRGAKRILWVVPLTLIGVGISLRNSRAVVRGWLRRTARFERTPKFGEEGARGRWRRSAYVPRADWMSGVEASLGVVGLSAAAWAFLHESYALVPGLSLFAVSYLLVALASFRESRRADRR